MGTLTLRARGYTARLVGCTLGMLLVAGAATAGAEEFDLGDDSGKGPNIQVPGFAWQTNYESNPIEGQENIPFEFVVGFPTTLVELINPPVQCEAWAAQYYNNLFEDGVLATTGLYYNRTLARARNPENGGKGVGGAPQRTPKAEAGPGTAMAGPYARSACPNRANAHAFVRMGGMTPGEGVQIAGGYSETKVGVDPANQKAGGDLVADVVDVTLPGLTIKHIHSTLTPVHLPDKEPTFTYSLLVEGVFAGETQLVGFGDQGLTFGGQNLTGPEAIKQFNEQANAQSAALEAAFIYGFKISEPRFYIDTAFDKFNFESPVVEGSLRVPARKGTIGDFQALRLGKTAYRGVFKTVRSDEYGGIEVVCGGVRSSC